jgi:hypothetical protein
MDMMPTPTPKIPAKRELPLSGFAMPDKIMTIISKQVTNC